MKSDKQNNTAVRIKELRDKLSLTQEEMAQQIGVSKSAYQKYEQAIRFPAFPVLRKLALESDVSMDWLIFGKGPMFYSGKRLNAELDRLQEQLQQSLHQMETMKAQHTQQLEHQAQQLALHPELKELIDQMKQNEVLYHEVLATYSRFKQENQTT